LYLNVIPVAAYLFALCGPSLTCRFLRDFWPEFRCARRPLRQPPRRWQRLALRPY